MGAKVGGSKSGAMADINVTPLVDVVLVLLIIFMVITPMLSSGVDVKLPEAKTATEEKDLGHDLVISVRKDGALFVDRTQVTLESVVAEVVKVRADRPIVVKGDASVTYGQVRGVLDVVHESVPNTDIITLAAEKLKE